MRLVIAEAEDILDCPELDMLTIDDAPTAMIASAHEQRERGTDVA